MSKADEIVLRDDVSELNEQLYASYARIIELVAENQKLSKQIDSQSNVINALAESARGRDSDRRT